jgi:tetratricopeptide (TPR) repeat protein
MPRRGENGGGARLVLAHALALVTIATGCAAARSSAYEAASAQASRDDGAGRFAEAARDYDVATSRADRQRDEDQGRWDAAAATARAGDVAGASRRYEAIASDQASEHQAEAALRLALLRIDSSDGERGWADLEQVPRRFPTHGVAHVAVRKLVQHADEAGPRAGLDELHALEADLGPTELAGLIAFLEAEHLEAMGDDRAARDAYGRIADRWPYPFGAFFDDALWHASLLDEKFGLYPAAIADLERLLRQRETTSLMGSYERPRFVSAMLRVGELYRDRMRDLPRAREAFHRFYTDFAHSSLRDRALWLEAALWREGGDGRTACDRLATLVEKFPDSRYVPCAIGQCPALDRPRTSGAPKECRDYIARTTPTGDGVERPRDGE